MLTSYQRDLLLQGEIEIDQRLDEADEIVPFQHAITSYGADYPVDSLVKRLQAEDIIIPNFQRQFVWTLREASRFVESLLLGLPVPSIFLSKEAETQKFLVIDGQQRLLSLRYFYNGVWPITRKEFALRGVVEKFEGQTYATLASEHRRRLDNSIIHTIIVKQDEPSNDSSSIYHIFERLNTTGRSLTPQEIRTAIYHGPFSDLLGDLNLMEAWRSVYGPPNRLMRDQELILRFLALYFDGGNYKRPMKAFLNSFMGRNRHLSLIPADRIRDVFVQTVDTVYRSLGTRAFRLAKVLNAAVFDAVMVGVARRLERGAVMSCETMRMRYSTLLSSKEFLLAAERATADEDSVSTRLRLASEAFGDVP
jgi:hypothetical protein